MNWWVKSTKRFCATPNYIEHFLILASAITGCVFISAFASVVGITVGISSSAIGLNVCAITTGTKKYKSITKEKKKKHDKTVLLAKSKLKSIQVLICNALINSASSCHGFVLISNVQKEYDNMKEKIKNSNNI